MLTIPIHRLFSLQLSKGVNAILFFLDMHMEYTVEMVPLSTYIVWLVIMFQMHVGCIFALLNTCHYNLVCVWNMHRFYHINIFLVAQEDRILQQFNTSSPYRDKYSYILIIISIHCTNVPSFVLSFYFVLLKHVGGHSFYQATASREIR